ncbi:DUF485 domain-containing protein [Gordonia crocea]|uniref:Membrane protein n=2 Tax=Gordonia crocea TaxID=589162 RepID=A0A7I9UZH8_9ACTN|nr:DUF485 domain-containing protein [Gordonia crocea]GED98303.1 membrane protein [Gordonia crocea]
MPESDDPQRSVPTGEEFLTAAASPEFEHLRRILLRFVFPMTAFFLVWYATYALLGAFAHEFMATQVWGRINMGIVLGLLQFVTTFAITFAYIRFADRKLDPAAEVVRQGFADGRYAAEAGR